MKPAGVKTMDWYYYNLLFFAEHWMGYKRFIKHFGKQQQKLFSKIDNYLAAAQTPVWQVRQVEIIDRAMDSEEFVKVAYNGPVVFKGVAKNWGAVKNWNLDFFEQNYGDQDIIIMDNVGITYNKYEKMKFKEYIAELRKGTDKYLKFSDFIHDNRELLDGLDLKWLSRMEQLPFSWGKEDARFFMGDKKSFTPLHVGFSSFLFTNIYGTKKWLLYPPNDRLFLDARSERTSYLFSRADPYEQNQPDFPLLKYATRYEVQLEAGDILWVPSFTWHYVENPTLTIAVRYGKGTMGAALKGSKMFTLLMLLATKPSLLEHFFISLTKKRESIFLKSQSQLDKEDLLNKVKIKQT